MMFNTALLLLTVQAYETCAFTVPLRSTRYTTTTEARARWQTAADLADTATTTPTDASKEGTEPEPFSGPVRAPLKFIGPYIGLGLNFPDLATTSQRAKNTTGIALDFVLDTAANINTLNGQVAKELNLEIVDEAPGGVSASGPMSGGHTYMLGSCELEGLPKDQQFVFMENLTASALPEASPAAAGLLSLPFFHCFEGGVEFDWQGKVEVDQDGQEQRLPPSVTFYDSADNDLRNDMTKVSIQEIPIIRLPKVELNINGVTIPALFDTGSPVTVLNSQAAEKAGIQTVDIDGNGDEDKNDGGFFGGIASKFKQAQAKAQAAARGDVLTIAGMEGQPVDLIKSNAPVDVTLGENQVDFGKRNVFVGNIPGLAALNALGDDSPPGAVLGMDILRSKSKMLLIGRDGEVYF